MKVHSKSPDNELEVRLDFSAFAARLAGAAVTYTLRADPGITVDVDTPSPSVFDLSVSGGRLGQAYLFGIEAAGGKRTEVQLHRVRLRPAERGWPSVPVVGVIGGERYVAGDYFAEDYVYTGAARPSTQTYVDPSYFLQNYVA